MFGFRGARWLVSFGHTNYQFHQQRLVSSGWTSVCQVRRKQMLISANVLPCLSLTFSQTLSTLGKGKKWPKPVDSHNNNSSGNVSQPSTSKPNPSESNKVFIGAYNFIYDEKTEEDLKQLFQQFGEVYNVFIPNRKQYMQTAPRPGQFRFGFIIFSDRKSCQNAVDAKEILDCNGNMFKIEAIADRMVEQTKSLFYLNDLPDDIRIDEIYHYCRTIGEVVQVNLVLHKPVKENTTYTRNMATVLFNANIASVELQRVLLGQKHFLLNSPITVERVLKSNRQSTQRSRKVFLDNCAQRVSEEQVFRHFNDMGCRVINVLLLRNKEGDESKSHYSVAFKQDSDAQKASEQLYQEIDEEKVRVRLLGMHFVV